MNAEGKTRGEGRRKTALPLRKVKSEEEATTAPMGHFQHVGIRGPGEVD